MYLYTYVSLPSGLGEAVVAVEVLVPPLVGLRLLAPGAGGHQGAGVSAANGVHLPVDEPGHVRQNGNLLKT